mgnify:CR=1 FL=1
MTSSLSSSHRWTQFLLSTIPLPPSPPIDAFSDLPSVSLAHILSFAGVQPLLSLASTSKTYFNRIIGSSAVFDEMHMISFGCYLPKGCKTAAKALYLERKRRANALRKARAPRVKRINKGDLLDSCSKGGNDEGRKCGANARSEGNKNVFCTLLLPPPPPALKYDCQLAVSRRNLTVAPPRTDWRLYVGVRGGSVEVHSIDMDETKSQDGMIKVEFVGELAGGLPENVLSITSTFSNSSSLRSHPPLIFASGDCGFVSCWCSSTLERRKEVERGVDRARKGMRGGSFAGYCMEYWDPYEVTDEEMRRRKRKKDDSSNGSDNKQPLRGNLLIGNINGNVVIYDLTAQAVSALLLSDPSEDTTVTHGVSSLDENYGEEESSYKGGCVSVSLLGSDKSSVIGLTDGGYSVRVWSLGNVEGVWDACPEVEGSVRIVTPVGRVRVDESYVKYGSICNLSYEERVEEQGSQGGNKQQEKLRVAIGGVDEPVLRFMEVLNGHENQYDNGQELDFGVSLGGGGGVFGGVTSFSCWGGYLVVGGGDGKLRLIDTKRGDDGVWGVGNKRPEETACEKAVEGEGLCPLQGVHAIEGGGSEGEMLALVSIGWDRSVRVWVPGNEAVGGEGEESEEGVEEQVAEGGEESFTMTEGGDFSYSEGLMSPQSYEGLEKGYEYAESDEEGAGGDHDDDYEIDEDDDGDVDVDLDLDDDDYDDDSDVGVEDGEKGDLGDIEDGDTPVKSVREMMEEMERVLGSEEGGRKKAEGEKEKGKDWRAAMKEAEKYLGA